MPVVPNGLKRATRKTGMV